MDVSAIRGWFPALADGGTAFLDGAGGTQVPTPVIRAVTEAYERAISNIGGAFESSAHSTELMQTARQAIADLVGGVADGVVLGPNATTLNYRLATALAKDWAPGDEVVVSNLDHDSNIRPWIQAAERVGVTTRWARVDAGTGELDPAQYGELVTDRTRLVAVSAASNLIGTIPDVAAICRTAHATGALTYVDAVAAVPHYSVDAGTLGADFLATSAYKWCGPHVGAVVAAPALLETLHPDKLKPSSDVVPFRFETGTLPFAQLAGVTAAVDFLGSLGGELTARRAKIRSAMSAVEKREMTLLAYLLGRLRDTEGIRLIGSPARRTAVVSFTARRHSGEQVARGLGARRVAVWHGHAYAWELARAMRVDADLIVRVSLAPYTSEADLDRFFEGLAELGYGIGRHD